MMVDSSEFADSIDFLERYCILTAEQLELAQFAVIFVVLMIDIVQAPL